MSVQTAPDFTLEHIAGHPVSLSDYRGRTVVVALAGRHSAEQMADGIKALRRTYDHDQLPILAVADMGGIPRPARVIAKRQLKSGYNDAVTEGRSSACSPDAGVGATGPAAAQGSRVVHAADTGRV